jgi:hypothetical protein
MRTTFKMPPTTQHSTVQYLLNALMRRKALGESGQQVPNKDAATVECEN